MSVGSRHDPPPNRHAEEVIRLGHAAEVYGTARVKLADELVTLVVVRGWSLRELRAVTGLGRREIRRLLSWP